MAKFDNSGIILTDFFLLGNLRIFFKSNSSLVVFVVEFEFEFEVVKEESSFKYDELNSPIFLILIKILFCKSNGLGNFPSLIFNGVICNKSSNISNIN
ncbi:hypothetical protein WICMUC_003524 [Wickerhamomyces mucosus]|uniref:Uncharacterized protein n=1 Tax=Wickerhamomyces mucosus TaxID=1378264 RepID=A0A9P8PK08_9ASCO|nr:hypothetical protein WICMUC_003524 [Wickerhamomyces mucosus]